MDLFDVDEILNSIPQGEVDNYLNADEIMKETDDFILQQNDNKISNNNIDIIQLNDESLKEMNNIDINEILYNKEIENSVNKKFNNSIDFINYMETEYIQSKLAKNEEVFQLSNYRKQQKEKKLKPLQFSQKTTLSSLFFKDGNIITSIAAKGNIIFTGNNIGKIKMYSNKKNSEYKILINDEIINSEDKRVLCMDISEDLNYLISGYSNGYIALWNIEKENCIKLLKDEHQRKSILAIKFLQCENGIYEFLSSDINGYVNRITISESYFFFSPSVECINIIKYTFPFFLIDILNFTNEEKITYSFIEDNNCQIIALACTEYILIYQIDPELRKLYELKKPFYFKKTHIPDIAFGLGYVPRNVNYNSNTEKYEYENILAKDNKIDLFKLERLIAISWEKIVYIYVLKFDKKNGPDELVLVGHYINSAQILRMGFLSNSIIYLFDMYKKFKIINTTLLTPNNISFNEENNPIPQINKNFKPELDEGISFDNILFQSIVPDKLDKGNLTLPTYNNLIISQKETLYVLAYKNLQYGKLLNWEQCLNDLNLKREWMETLSLGLDIYNGTNIILPDIPIEENKRKIRVVYSIKGLILQYVVYCINESKNNKNEDEIVKCMNICIEFCIEINEMDYLLNQIQPKFDGKGYGNIFIEKLEPFILCGKIKNHNLGQNTISKIVELYIKKKKFHILSQILTHLDIQSIDADEIKKICCEHILISPLIYIYMNSPDNEFFEAIIKIYNMYENAKEIEKEKFISYENILKNIPTSELEICKQYIGDKLLWYINICIDGKKFITNDFIDIQQYEILIQKIFLWLLKKQILDEFLSFDSLSLFSILVKFFTEDITLKTILLIKYDKENDIFEDIFYNEKEIEDFNLELAINIIIERAKRVNKISINNDLCEFICKISIHIDNISDIIIKETAKYILSSESRIKDYKKEDDIFGFRNKDLSIFEIKRLSNLINDMIERYKSKLKKNDIKEILNSTEKTSFVLVKIYLLKLLKENLKCLDTYLIEYKYSDKTDKIYLFIDNILKDYKKENNEEFEIFKNEIHNRFILLARLSMNKFIDLIGKWFDNNHIASIEKLNEDKEIELKYIEKVLDSYKENNLPTDDEEMLIYSLLLSTHIELLCELNKKDQILPNLKKRASYPDQCLDICLENKVYDAAIYLYLHQDNINDALELSNNVLKEDYEKLINVFKENKIKDTSSLIEKHNEILDSSINICEKANDDEKIIKEMWFGLVKLCYEYRKKIIKLKINSILKIIIEDIQKVFEKIYSYVGIKSIVEYVTINNKEVEFKEFKPILIQMLYGYTNLYKIFEIERKLIRNSFGGELKIYNDILLKGNFYYIKKCDECEENFVENDIISLFKCGHQFHLICCLKEENDLICPICRNEEIQSSITSFKGNQIKISKVNNSDIEKYMLKKKIRKNDINNNERNYSNILKKIDKHYFDNILIFN